MPTKPTRPCPYPLCDQFQPCPEHSIERESSRARRRRSPHRALYDTEAWERLRAQVLEEEPWCRCTVECCPGGCTLPSTDADHVVPLGPPHYGARLDRTNVQGLAHSCHSRKTARELRATGRW